MFRRVVIAVLTFAAADIAIVWAVSRSHSIAIRPASGALAAGVVYELTAHRGTVHITHGRVRRQAMTPGECSIVRRGRQADEPQERRVQGGFLGFGYDSVSRTDQLLDGDPPLRKMVQVVTVRLPCWLLLVLCIAYLGIAFVRGSIRRWRRTRPGLCTSCGYNLTGNISGVCPECGANTPDLVPVSSSSGG